MPQYICSLCTVLKCNYKNHILTQKHIRNCTPPMYKNEEPVSESIRLINLQLERDQKELEEQDKRIEANEKEIENMLRRFEENNSG
jgi:hypothetical protein